MYTDRRTNMWVEHLECYCYDDSHGIRIIYDPDDKWEDCGFDIEVRSTGWFPFLMRVWLAFKFIFDIGGPYYHAGVQLDLQGLERLKKFVDMVLEDWSKKVAEGKKTE